MDSTTASRPAQIVLTVGALSLAALLFSPFFAPILWAVVLSYALYPLYRRILHFSGERQALSAFLMCIVMTIGLLLPLLYLTLLITQGLAEMISSLLAYLHQKEDLVGEGWRRYPVIAGFAEQLQSLERLTGTNLRSSLVDAVADFGRLLIQQSTTVVRNLLLGVVQFGIVLLCAFYFFRDGAHIVEWMKETLPLTPGRRRLVFRRFEEVVKGAIYGNTVVALLEALIVGVAFWLVGLPSPILWGSVTAITAYLPLIGASLVWIPAVIYFGAQGAYVQMIVLVAAGIGITGVDYLVRNIVVGRASHLPSLIMFFSVIGGVELFGLVGIIAGPFVVAVAMALLDTYRDENSALAALNTSKEELHEERILHGGGAS